MSSLIFRSCVKIVKSLISMSPANTILEQLHQPNDPPPVSSSTPTLPFLRRSYLRNWLRRRRLLHLWDTKRSLAFHCCFFSPVVIVLLYTLHFNNHPSPPPSVHSLCPLPLVCESNTNSQILSITTLTATLLLSPPHSCDGSFQSDRWQGREKRWETGRRKDDLSLWIEANLLLSW